MQVGLLATEIALEARRGFQTPALEPGLLWTDRQIEVALRNERFEASHRIASTRPRQEPGRHRGRARVVLCNRRAIPGKSSRPGLKSRPLCVVHEAGGTSSWRKSKVRVIDSKPKSMLGARGEHPVRFEATSSHQIIDEDADVAIATFDPKRKLTGHEACRICSRHQTLRGRFFVAGRAVDLSGEEKPDMRLVSRVAFSSVGWMKSYSTA